MQQDDEETGEDILMNARLVTYSTSIQARNKLYKLQDLFVHFD